MSDSEESNSNDDQNENSSSNDSEESNNSENVEGLKARIAELQSVADKQSQENRDNRLKLKELKDAQKNADDDKLVDQKKFKELFEQEKAGRVADREKSKTQAIKHELEIEAVKLGIMDKEFISHADDSNVVYDDDKLKVYGAEEAIKALKKSKPFIFGEKVPPKNPDLTKPNFDNSTPVKEVTDMKGWTQEQIKEHFRKNRGKIKNVHGTVRNRLG